MFNARTADAPATLLCRCWNKRFDSRSKTRNSLPLRLARCQWRSGPRFLPRVFDNPEYNERIFPKRGTMDNVTLIRVVAGILAVVVFVILVLRMRKKAPR